MSVSEADFFGGAKTSSLASNRQLAVNYGRVRTFGPVSSGLSLQMPDARSLRVGGPQFYIYNDSATEDLGIEDAIGGGLATLSPGEIISIWLMDNSSEAGFWVSRESVAVGGPGLILKTIQATNIITTSFAVDIEKAGDVNLAAINTISTQFAAQIKDDPSKEFAATCTITTQFDSQFATIQTSNIVSATATGGGDGTLGDPYTLKQAQEITTAPATYYLRGGTYSASDRKDRFDTSSNNMQSGTSAVDRITFTNYANETPILLGRSKLDNIQHVTFQNLYLNTEGGRILLISSSSTATSDIQFIGCDFNGTRTDAGGPYSALTISAGSNYHFKKCTFREWDYGDFLKLEEVSDITLEDCDNTHGWAGHALWHARGCSQLIIKGCSFRNQWERCLQIMERNGNSDILIEDNILFDSNWNRLDPHAQDTQPGGENSSSKGSSDVVRISSPRTIVRNNLIVGANAGKNGVSTAAIHMQFYEDGYQFKSADDCRFYNNTIHRSYFNSFSLSRDSAVQNQVSAKRAFWFNNSMSEAGAFEWFLRNSDLSFSDWKIENNRFANTTKTLLFHLDGENPEEQTLSQVESNYTNQFKNNIEDDPDFKSEATFNAIDIDESLFKHSDYSKNFMDYFENSGAAGKGAGRYLTQTNGTGSSTDVITVDDGYVFWDGNSHSTGDSIIIGSNDPVIVTAVNSATAITVDTSITYADGDNVYLERQTTSPDIGIYQLTVGLTSSFQATCTITTQFTTEFRLNPSNLAGTIAAVSGHSADLKTTANLVDINHEVGDLSEYDSSITDGDDLSVTAGAALNGTSFGLSALIDGTGKILARKLMVQTADTLRTRIYIDPNSLSMAGNDEFDILRWDKDANGFNYGYIRLGWDSGTGYYVKGAYRGDSGGSQSSHQTSDRIDITDAPHYIETRVVYASSASAEDGVLQIFVDGVQKHSNTSLDLYSLGKPTRIDIGATSGIEATTSGTFYLDELIVREVDTVIGA